MAKNLEVKGSSVRVFATEDDDDISLTDIAKYKNAEAGDDLIRTGSGIATRSSSWASGSI